MTEFEVIFTLNPTGPFGLPEDGVTVVPGITSTSSTAVVDTWSGTVVGYGALSVFRTEPVSAELTLKCATVRLGDNFLFCKVTAADENEAMTVAEKLVHRFCVGLSLKLPIYFYHSLHGGSRSDTRSPMQLPLKISLGTMRFYSTSALTSAASELETLLNVDDPLLDRANAYFYHATFLMDFLNRSNDPNSFHTYYTFTEAILNFYKAISVIIGDPSCGDKHQSQYKKYGIDRELWINSEEIRQARNNMDVAHYKAIPEQFQEVAVVCDKARRVAGRVIEAYLVWLKNNQES